MKGDSEFIILYHTGWLDVKYETEVFGSIVKQYLQPTTYLLPDNPLQYNDSRVIEGKIPDFVLKNNASSSSDATATLKSIAGYKFRGATKDAVHLKGKLITWKRIQQHPNYWNKLKEDPLVKEIVPGLISIRNSWPVCLVVGIMMCEEGDFSFSNEASSEHSGHAQAPAMPAIPSLPPSALVVESAIAALYGEDFPPEYHDHIRVLSLGASQSGLIDTTFFDVEKLGLDPGGNFRYHRLSPIRNTRPSATTNDIYYDTYDYLIHYEDYIKSIGGALVGGCFLSPEVLQKNIEESTHTGEDHIELDIDMIDVNASHDTRTAEDLAAKKRRRKRSNVILSDFKEANEHRMDPELCQQARDWIDGFAKLRLKQEISLTKGLKIAILDTGIDKSKVRFDSSVVETVDFIDDKPMTDVDGHGTHIAGIMLKLLENCELFICKVLSSRVTHDRKPIAAALRRARKDWKVDAISMSFGYEISGYLNPVRKEVSKCLKSDIMVFAAASNNGIDKPRTYPSLFPGVFCIHSCSGEGAPSGFNPKADDKEQFNFCTVGECVESMWTSENAGPRRKIMSGTSVATPIAVCLAALMIGYVRRHMSDFGLSIDPCSVAGMQRMFSLVSTKQNGYDWISPGLFFSTTFRENIPGLIGQSLQSRKKELEEDQYE